MNQEQNTTKKNGCCRTKQTPKPSDIKGKIEVADKRERRDGPGGN